MSLESQCYKDTYKVLLGDLSYKGKLYDTLHVHDQDKLGEQSGAAEPRDTPFNVLDLNKNNEFTVFIMEITC